MIIYFKDHKFSLLTWTSTMDCWSFSLPAGKEGACPLAIYGDNTICGSCYASINRFNMPNVAKAQWLRFNWLNHHLKTKNGFEYLVETFVDIINKNVKNNYFRVFDSGDFHNIESIKLWYAICSDKRLKHIKWWFPTRVWYAKNDWAYWITKLSALPKVSIRPSAIKFNDSPPKIKGLIAGTTVITSEDKLPKNCSICPKSLNSGSCESNGCRTCWNNDKRSVAYLVHGYTGSSSVPIITDKIKKLRMDNKLKFTALTIERNSNARV